MAPIRRRARQREGARSSDEQGESAEPLVGNSPTDEESISWPMTVAAFAFPALGGLLFGYDISASSGAIDSLTDATRSGTEWGPPLAASEQSIAKGFVVSGSLIGALGSSLVAVAYGDSIGRRRELLTASALFIIGGVGMWNAWSYGVLVSSRVLYGLGIGFAMHGAPIYIGETAPTRVRGTLVSLKEAVIVSGILLGYLLGYSFSGDVGSWRTLWGLTAPLGVVFGAGMLALPNSPRFLLYKGNEEEAQRALQRLRSIDGPQAERELQTLKLAQEESEAGGSGSTATEGKTYQVRRLLQGSNKKALTIGMSLMLFQQITGQPSVLYYATDIARQAGFSNTSAASFVSVGLGIVKLVTTLFATTSIENFGRRPLLLGGVSVLTGSLLVLTVLSGERQGTASAYLSLAAILVYTGAYQVRI